MATNITCPHCSMHFDIENVMASELDKKYKSAYQEKLQAELDKVMADKQKLELLEAQFEEKRKKQNEIFADKLRDEKEKMELEFLAEKQKAALEMQENLRKSISSDFENKLKMLAEDNADKEEKLKAARNEQLSLMKQQQALKQKEEALEIELQKKLQQERETIKQDILRQQEERLSLKETEYQLKLQEERTKGEAQLKLIEELKRRAEQGSMQLQGEAQEILLEKLLKEQYPFDIIDEIKKGKTGADCIQTVRGNMGIEYGKIIFESKRTKGWGKDWAAKLKQDMRLAKCDLAILVTEVLPDGIEGFGEYEGVWVCTFKDVKSVSALLRQGLMNVYDAQMSQEGKADKMKLLYNYLTGAEFKGHVESIAEGFTAMRDSITRERMQMEKNWKEREKQLEKVLLNTSGLYGSVRGIAGGSVHGIPLLDGDENTKLLTE